MNKVTRFRPRLRLVANRPQRNSRLPLFDLDPLPQRLKLPDEVIEALGQRFQDLGLQRMTTFARYLVLDDERRAVIEAGWKDVEAHRTGVRPGGVA